MASNLAAVHAATHRDLITHLQALDHVTALSIEHTGGGCYGLALTLEDGRYVFATDAYQTREGRWEGDSNIPEAGQPWAIGLYATEDAFYENEEEITGHGLLAPCDDQTFVAYVRGLRHQEG